MEITSLIAWATASPPFPTGAVVALQPVHTESAESICEAMQMSMAAAHLASVRHITTDDPSVRLLTKLQEICPSIQAISLDPMHIAYVYEAPAYRRRTPGSAFLRKILARTAGRGAVALLEHRAIFNGHLAV